MATTNIGLSKYGDWIKAGVVLKALNVKLIPLCKAQLQDDGELILQTLKGHIEKQDLPWVPLSEKTIQLKHGDDTIYVETGFLYDNLLVRKVKSSSDSVTYFIGASPWVKTKDGKKLSDIMIWLEYGTDRVPPRPLIRPTAKEIKPLIENNWEAILGDLITNMGG